MSKPEPYRKGLSPLQSQHRKVTFTSAHFTVLSILSANRIIYKAEESIPVYNEFDSQGRPVVYRVDVLISDARYGSGVIEVDGEAHDGLKQMQKDARKDARLSKLGLWIERVPNSDVGNVMDYLRKHQRQVGEWP